MRVEILYLAFNRLAFTQVSFGLLLEHTDWSLVDKLVVYDDGSKDGTAEWLEDAVKQSAVEEIEFWQTKLGSPVEVMIDYLGRTDCDVFAKIDSDIAVPDGWLAPALGVMERERIDLLGLAAGWTGTPADALDILAPASSFAFIPASNIGGVGLFRTSAFRRHPDLWSHGRFGLTEWQHRHNPPRGWITPDLPVVQLDLIPEEPWRTLADYYVAKGWARAWPPYDQASSGWWSWIPVPELETVP